MRAAAGIVAVATLVAAGRADAQEELRAQCTTGGATVPFCELAVLGLENLAARAGIVSAGGNPVPGTASTFGMRLGPLPRMSLAARFTVMPVELPPIFVRGQDETPDGLASSVNLDASVGLFTGFSVAPTVGGLPNVEHMRSNVGEAAILAPCDYPFPPGGVLAQGERNQDQVVAADLDFGQLARAQSGGSVRTWQDRRGELYSLID